MIRRGNLKDLDRIYYLINGAKELRATEDTTYSKDFLKVYLKNPVNFVFVYEEKEKILGVITGEIWKKEKYAYLANIIVDQKHRKKQIATKLYNYLENKCKRLKLSSIKAFARINNKKIHRFNKKMGFKKGHIFYFFEKKL